MLTLEVLLGCYAVCGLTVMPEVDWGGADLLCVSRTRDQVTLICLEETLKPEIAGQIERGWRVLHLHGTFAFDQVGILAGISQPLAEAGIGIFAISTYDTDYILIKDEHLASAIDALRAAGYHIVTDEQP